MLWLGRRLFFGHLGAVGCATALALARVLAFATIVARFAAALALARVLAFTGVFFLHLLVRLLVGLLICILRAGGTLLPLSPLRTFDSRARSHLHATPVLAVLALCGGACRWSWRSSPGTRSRQSLQWLSERCFAVQMENGGNEAAALVF